MTVSASAASRSDASRPFAVLLEPGADEGAAVRQDLLQEAQHRFSGRGRAGGMLGGDCVELGL